MVGRGPEAFDVDDSRAKNSGRLDYYYTYSDIEIGNRKRNKEESNGSKRGLV